jgi:RecB family exonuclease
VDRFWTSEGFRDTAQADEYRERARGWVVDYAADLDPDVEPVGLEQWVSVATDRIVAEGRVDRIDRRGDQLVVVDYKTGRRTPTAADAAGSRALALYALATERTLRRQCTQVELHHLPSAAVAAHEHTDESLARHLARAEATAADAVAAEQTVGEGGDPDAAFPPTPGALCSWCDFRRSCPAGAAAPARDPWAGLLHDGG